MLIVLDTNVIVSALLTSPGTCQRVLDLILHAEMEMAVCDGIVAEYQSVLSRPRIKIPQDKAATFLLFAAALPSVALEALESIPPLGLPDPDDEVFLAAALVAKADYLVTGNLRHFPPHLRRGVNVVTPAQFLKVLPPTW